MAPPWTRRFAWLPVRLTENGVRGSWRCWRYIEERCWDAGWLAHKSYDRRLSTVRSRYFMPLDDLYTISELHPEEFTLGLRIWFWIRMLVGGVIAMVRK